MPIPRFRIRTLMIAVAALAVLIAGWRFGDWAHNHQQREFLGGIHLGDKPESVRLRCGEPIEKLSAGSTLPRWGGRPARVMPGETWVYYMGFGGVHRIAIIFGSGRVVRVIHDLT